jgi:hypothetical protein
VVLGRGDGVGSVIVVVVVGSEGGGVRRAEVVEGAGRAGEEEKIRYARWVNGVICGVFTAALGNPRPEKS